jgi:hypothetical protein
MLDLNNTCKTTCQLSAIIEPRSAWTSIGGFFMSRQFASDMNCYDQFPSKEKGYARGLAE